MSAPLADRTLAIIAAFTLFSLLAGHAMAAPPRGLETSTLVLEASVPTTTRNVTLGLTWTGVSVKKPRRGTAQWITTASLGTDSVVTGVVNGFLLDDVHGLRITGELRHGIIFDPFKPFRSQRTPPRVSVGLATWGLLETHRLLQAFRTEDAGLYAGMHIGPFVAVHFRTLTIAFFSRPLVMARNWTPAETLLLGPRLTPSLLDFQVSVPLYDVNLEVEYEAD